MVKVIRQGVYLTEGRLVRESQAFMTSDKKEVALRGTIARRILDAHDRGEEQSALKADALFLEGEDDILRTADALALKEFPLPVYLFPSENAPLWRTAAEKWGGNYIPFTLASPAEFALVVGAGGKLYFGNSDVSLGALGAMCVSVAQGDVLRTLTKNPFVVERPETVALHLKGKLRKGVGPTDVALAVEKAAGALLENKVIEVFGAGEQSLSMDCRIALDRALFALGCFSTVWATDEKTEDFFLKQGRKDDFAALAPCELAYYDAGIVVDLSKIEPMIGYNGTITPVREFVPPEEYDSDGKILIRSATIDESAATFETISEIADILQGKPIGPGTSLSISLPRAAIPALAECGALSSLVAAGVDFNDVDPSADGPEACDGCFLPNGYFRLDARTTAVSAATGTLTPALGYDYHKKYRKFSFSPALYESRLYRGIGNPSKALDYGVEEPIAPLPPLPERLELELGVGAVLLEDSEDYAWGMAIFDRERGAFAVLAKRFSDHVKTHLIDWGLIPLVYEKFDFKEGDVLKLERIRARISSGEERFIATVVGKRRTRDVALTIGKLSEEERALLLQGGKINASKRG